MFTKKAQCYKKLWKFIHYLYKNFIAPSKDFWLSFEHNIKLRSAKNITPQKSL